MMSTGFAEIPTAERYVLRNAHVPTGLLDETKFSLSSDGIAAVDIVVDNGRIAAIHEAGTTVEPACCDLRGGMILPGFIDVHTHLDKGHIWPRAKNPDGTFMGAIQTVPVDRAAHWSGRDVAARMDFALRCAYSHGTVAIRTHIDSLPPQDAISWPIFEEMREKWRGKIDLQAVSLMGGDQALDTAILSRVARQAKRSGGLLGIAIAGHPRTAEVVRTLVQTAGELGLDLDLHLDETQDAGSIGLRCLAEEVLRSGFSGRVTAGHCCSLARQEASEAARTIELVAEAGISIVSLPMCNLYLQDRSPETTPRFRGITLLRELSAAGVLVAIASDNTRDPFYAYGDLDPLEVLREGIRIGHLDHPLDDVAALVTRNPARIMGLRDRGRLAESLPADLVLLKGRNWSEALSRPESERTILRDGRPIPRDLPDYRELDALMAV